jgi:hypothetical protein
VSILRFQPADVLRVCEHATKHNGEVLLVHDQGVYLMSGAEPRDLVGPGCFCAYAQGMNPDKDEDWWSTASDAVGGDDFGEKLSGEWVGFMLDDARKGKPTCIKVNANSMRLMP